MRDIGKIEKRVTNLEYYTSLNLLEKETADLVLKDANGLDRLKNGLPVPPLVWENIKQTADRLNVENLERFEKAIK